MTPSDRLMEIQARIEGHDPLGNAAWWRATYEGDVRWLLARITKLESEITHLWKEDVRSLTLLVEARDQRIAMLEAALQAEKVKT